MANPEQKIEACIQQSQDLLMQEQKRMHAEDAMKTTLTVLDIRGGEAQFFHVGDSRIYYFHKGKYTLRSQDHSVPQMLYMSGRIREKEIRHHEDRSKLLKVMGIPWNTPKYEASKVINTGKKDGFLLCSDGFWELIEEKTMSKLLKKSSTPQEWLAAMRQEVLKNGTGTNMDNYSAIAVVIK
jgi:serine/threonine protein phosphatase PrpC